MLPGEGDRPAGAGTRDHRPSGAWTWQTATATWRGVVHRVVPAHLACRIGARTRAGERNAWAASGTMKRPHRQVPAEQEPAQHEHAEVRGRTEAVTTGRNCHA